MYKIQYKYRKWDKEIKKSTAIKAIDLQHKNIQTTIDLYLNPEKFDEEIIRDIRINDSASFFNQLGQHRINHNSGRNDKEKVSTIQRRHINISNYQSQGALNQTVRFFLSARYRFATANII